MTMAAREDERAALSSFFRDIEPQIMGERLRRVAKKSLCAVS